MKGFKHLSGLLLICGILTSTSNVFAAQAPIYTGFFNNTAVSGYDVVAYFTQSKPVKGSSKYTSDYLGAEFRFSSIEHKALFDENPASYAPQYGGYCAWAVSQGYTASADPEFWKIADGKLYLNYNRKIYNTWLKDIPGFIEAANSNWPNVLE